jgi:hypothetical protein
LGKREKLLVAAKTALERAQVAIKVVKRMMIL